MISSRYLRGLVKQKDTPRLLEYWEINKGGLDRRTILATIFALLTQGVIVLAKQTNYLTPFVLIIVLVLTWNYFWGRAVFIGATKIRNNPPPNGEDYITYLDRLMNKSQARFIVSPYFMVSYVLIWVVTALYILSLTLTNLG